MTELLRVTVDVAEDGSLTLPAEVRHALGLTGAGKVVFIQDEAGIELTTTRRITERVRALAAPYLQGRGSLADELSADRRAEAAREDAEDAAYQAARSRPRDFYRAIGLVWIRSKLQFFYALS